MLSRDIQYTFEYNDEDHEYDYFIPGETFTVETPADE